MTMNSEDQTGGELTPPWPMKKNRTHPHPPHVAARSPSKLNSLTSVSQPWPSHGRWPKTHPVVTTRGSGRPTKERAEGGTPDNRLCHRMWPNTCAILHVSCRLYITAMQNSPQVRVMAGLTPVLGGERNRRLSTRMVPGWVTNI